jgi:hypothetical protein
MDLNKILELKNQANNLTKEKKWNEAEISYKNIIKNIDEIPNEKITDEILNQKKFILSNLSLVLVKQNKIKESKKIDVKIITKLDKNFSKSYARLVLNYLEENNFSCARYHYNLMKTNCKNDTNKFPELIEKMDKKIEENDSETNNLKMLLNLFKTKN